MRKKASMGFMILLVVVMIGVVFGILTDSRNSILIKEMFYVAGGSIAAMMAAVFIFAGVPCFKERIPPLTLYAVAAVLLLMAVMHFAGIGSPNGPFTFLMLLSLSSLTVSSLMFIEEAHIRHFTAIMIGSAYILFIYAVMQWQGINVFPWDAALIRSGRSTGSLGNPNLLGGFASAVIPLGITYLFSLKNLSKVLKASLSILFVVLATASIVASGTRGSLIGVVAGTVVLFIWFLKNSSKSMWKVVSLSIFLIAVIAASAVPMSSRLAELDPGQEDQGTLQVRKIIWSGALSLFAESPLLGHGPGSFQILFPEYRNPCYSLLGVSHNTLHAHCEYLEILVDIGILGLILWAAALLGLARRIRDTDLLRAGAFAGMIAMLAEGFVSVHLRWPPTAWLFATLVMIFLSRKCESVPATVKTRIGAAGLVLVSLILASGFFIHYLPASRSSILVFRGKDMFLSRTETAMNAAYSAAVQWADYGNEDALNAAIVQWQNASVYADSSVAYSREATEIYPYDLGGWYALGSAHLTRYMVMNPPVPAMHSALQAAGLSDMYTNEEVRAELLNGMAAYDSLMTMAPNYAEVHNNLALGYSNLGMLNESMCELYKSYNIHAHRREDYFNQVSSLISICPNSLDGALLYFNHILAGFDLEATGVKLDKNYAGVVQNAWYLISVQPENTIVLKDEFSAMVERILPCEYREIIVSRIGNIQEYSPFATWDNGAVLQQTDEDALQSFHRMFLSLAFKSRAFPTAMPSDRAFYAYPASILFHSLRDQTVFSEVMDIYLSQIVIDRSLDDVNSLVCSDRFYSSINPSVSGKIRSVRIALGGSRTALREGFEMPWLEGSLPSLVSDSLHCEMVSDSTNSQWYEMELHMTFLLVTSYWWDLNIFASEQNQYLLDRIFYCRNKIRDINPENWEMIVSGILENEIDRISFWTEGECPPTVEILRDDLVSGAARVSN